MFSLSFSTPCGQEAQRAYGMSLRLISASLIVIQGGEAPCLRFHPQEDTNRTAQLKCILKIERIHSKAQVNSLFMIPILLEYPSVVSKILCLSANLLRMVNLTKRRPKRVMIHNKRWCKPQLSDEQTSKVTTSV